MFLSGLQELPVHVAIDPGSRRSHAGPRNDHPLTKKQIRRCKYGMALPSNMWHRTYRYLTVLIVAIRQVDGQIACREEISSFLLEGGVG